MAVFHAFCALRPTREKAASVAAVPYDVVNREEAKEIGDANPDSFLHVDRAEMDLEPGIDLYDARVYEKARENLYRMESEETLIQDREKAYYLYELTRNGKVQTGITGCASIDDYQNNVIKKHELTRADKEEDRIRHVDVCDANTGPIFLAARFPQRLLEMMEQWKAAQEPEYDFTAEDGIRHRVWVISEAGTVGQICRAFEGMDALYIADGHHRAASAVKVGLKRREENPDFTGEEEFNFFLSVVFPFEQLTILPYHRVVKDLNGMAERMFIRKLNEQFELLLMSDFPCKPVEKHCFGMYTGGAWYHLKALPALWEEKDVVGQLDVSILQDTVLGPLLGIGDPRTDERIFFVGGSHTLKELQEKADQTDGVAFAMFPTSMEELMGIADAGRLMPPKSTWFEPKLRSGLFIHKLS